MDINSKVVRREVPADLIEATPGHGGLGHWVLASPLLLFLCWLWVDLIRALRPFPFDWLNALLGVLLFVALIVLPFGVAAHYMILAAPRLFHSAGWDIVPLEPVAQAEQYLVRYKYRTKHRAKLDWRRIWLRAVQGWVFIEMAVILIGAVVMLPLYMSAVEFGFGR
jgi:hypothetical protein